jgi:hypothetical protein
MARLRRLRQTRRSKSRARRRLWLIQGSFDDPASRAGDGVCHARSLIVGIGEDALDEGKTEASSLVEDPSRAAAMLDISGMNDEVQEKGERVDENMPFAARDLLARIIALRVERRAPF